MPGVDCKKQTSPTGAALPPPGRRSQEATLDEEEREDRYMSAALDVFMDYRNSV